MQLVEIQRIDAVLSTKYQVLIYRRKWCIQLNPGMNGQYFWVFVHRSEHRKRTFGVWMNPRRGAVNLQRAAVKHFWETGSHLKQREAARLRTVGLRLSQALKCQPGFNKLGLSTSLCGAPTTTEYTAVAAEWLQIHGSARATRPADRRRTMGQNIHSPGLWESEADRW